MVVARNYQSRTGDGELDLVARDGDLLVIIEVKSRTSEEYGPPDLAVTPEKRRKLVRTAFEYARRAHISEDLLRFDIVSVVHLAEPRITHFRDAFGFRSSPVV